MSRMFPPLWFNRICRLHNGWLDGLRWMCPSKKTMSLNFCLIAYYTNLCGIKCSLLLFIVERQCVHSVFQYLKNLTSGSKFWQSFWFHEIGRKLFFDELLLAQVFRGWRTAWTETQRNSFCHKMWCLDFLNLCVKLTSLKTLQLMLN